MPSRPARPSSSKGRHKSHVDSFCSTKATPSLSLSSFSHFRALACPTADPERVVLLRGFYWKSSAADLRQVCEQDFGPVCVQTPFAIPLIRLFTDHMATEGRSYCIKGSSIQKRLWILCTAVMQRNVPFNGPSQRRFTEQKMDVEIDRAS